MRRRDAMKRMGAAVFGVGSGLVFSRLSLASAPTGGTVTGTVTVRQGRRVKRDASGVVVFIDGIRQPPVSTPNAVHEIRQIDREFHPTVSVVTVGTTINFPNDDKIHHNVFSTSSTQPFDLGLYDRGESKSIVAERTGIIEVRCDRHHEMQAWIVVLDQPYFEITNRKGEFSIPGIPAGRYDLVAWVANGQSWREKVDVEVGRTTRVEVEVSEDLHQPRRLHKDGTPYRGYP